MTDWKSMFFRLVKLSRPEKTVNDEAEIIGWATHEDGQHYPIHAAGGGGGGSSGASSGGGKSSSGGGSSKSEGGSGGSGKKSFGAAKTYEENSARQKAVREYALPIGEKKLKEAYPDEKFENVRALGEKVGGRFGLPYFDDGKTKIFVSAKNSNGKRRRYRVGYMDNKTGDFEQDLGVENV